MLAEGECDGLVDTICQCGFSLGDRIDVQNISRFDVIYLCIVGDITSKKLVNRLIKFPVRCDAIWFSGKNAGSRVSP